MNASLTHNTVSRGPNATPQRKPGKPQAVRAVLDAIRQQDLTSYSDTDLKGIVARMRAQSPPLNIAEALPDVFALISEVISRRLGVWRIFDPSFDRCPLSETLQQCWITDMAATDSADQQTVADALSKTKQEISVRQSWEISLPAEFYGAVARLDTGGILSFQVTDEQVLAGLYLYRGNIVQMNAGEGKTVAGAFPAMFHALAGTSVHVITANDYLAARDADLLAPVYKFLGITVGGVLGYMEDDERRYNYQQAVVYSTMRELGFDYLRDNLKTTPGSRVQNKLGAAVIDEADHALIDEASTPMIISGAPLANRSSLAKVKRAITQMIGRQKEVTKGLANEITRTDTSLKEGLNLLSKLLLAEPDNDTLERHLRDEPRRFKQIRSTVELEEVDLTPDLYYVIDPDRRFVTLTDTGRDFLVGYLGSFYDGRSLEDSLESIWTNDTLPLPERRKKAAGISTRLARQYNLGNQVYQMLRAYLLLQRDVDYLVAENQLVLIDKATGRPRPDAIYQHGLQPALESKEGLPPHPESETVGHISVEGFVKQFSSICGMTGTAIGSEDEFQQKYGMPITVLPPTHELQRLDLGYRVYLSNSDKDAAIVDQVASSNDMGQPVLVGTQTVEQSQEISCLLSEKGISHNLLNAVNSNTEAEIIRNAGNFGAVTVATNMAGRGTDILLESDLDAKITRRHGQLTHESLESTGSGMQSLKFALGLRVIGTELNETPRIDLQLNGRSGRQGSFGVSQTFLSLEDRLLNLHVDGILKQNDCLTSDGSGRAFYSGEEINRHVQQMQGIADNERVFQRALTQDYASVLDNQTGLFYRRRGELVDSSSPDDGQSLWAEMAQKRADRLVSEHFTQISLEDYQSRFDRLVEEVQLDYHVDCSPLRGWDMNLLPQELAFLFTERIAQSETKMGAKKYAAITRPLYLKTCDDLWKSHIVELQDSISNQLLATSDHKSAVALYIQRSFQTWNSFWDRVNAEFLPRLLTFKLEQSSPEPTVHVNEEVYTLIMDRYMGTATATGSTGRH